MKLRFVLITLLLSLLLATMSSCTKHDSVIDPSGEDNTKVVITADMGSGGGKINFEDPGSGNPVYLTWSKGDRIGAFDNTGALVASFVLIGDGGYSTGSFEVEPGGTFNETDVYTFVYPYNSQTNISQWTMDFTGQSQTGNTGKNTLSEFCYMKGSNIGKHIAFAHEASLLTVDLTKPLGYLDSDGMPVKLVFSNDGITYTLDMSGITDWNIVAYLMIAPYKSSGSRLLEFTVTSSSGATFYYNYDSDKNYESGMRYTANLKTTKLVKTFTLADLSSIPSDLDTWVITDNVNALTDLSALTDAINAASQNVKLIMPAATSLGNNKFNYCSKLSSVDFPRVVLVGGTAFYHCEELQTLKLPSVITIDGNAVSQCDKLKSIYLPKLTTIGDRAFAENTQLVSINLPMLTSLPGLIAEFDTAIREISIGTAVNAEFQSVSRLALIDNRLPIRDIILTLNAAEEVNIVVTPDGKTWRGFGPFKDIVTVTNP